MAYQTAIITGGSRGIGKETAVQLFKMGLNVVIYSRDQLEIETTVAEIKEIGNQTEVLIMRIKYLVEYFNV